MPAPRIISTGRTLFGTPGYRAKILHIFGPSVVAYWPQNEAAGTVSRDLSGHAYNGAYTGVTLGAAGIGDGNTAASFDGTTSYNNIYSAGLAAAFNNQEGTLLAWLKVSGVGVWTDTVSRGVFSLQSDASNRVFIYKNSTNNVILCRYSAGGTNSGVSVATTSVAWLCAAITFSKSGDAVKAYLNGVQQGTTQTGLGVWSGALANNTTAIGATVTTPTGVFSGSIGPVVLLNRAATAAEMLQAATV